jgi:hypothetical protein
VPEAPQQPEPAAIDLKDPVLAGLLAWAVPGLGHWYQGRRAKAVLFFVCIIGLFCYGLYLGGGTHKDRDNKPRSLGYGRAVYFQWNNDERRLPYICQVGVGLAALPALVQANSMNNGRAVHLNGFMAPPRPTNLTHNDPNFNQPTAHDLHNLLGRYFELAGFFTMVAGLLNVLAIYDACAGPVVVHAPVKKEDKKEEGAA